VTLPATTNGNALALLADLDPDGFWTLAALAERDDDL